MYKDENHNANLGAMGQNNKINLQSKIKTTQIKPHSIENGAKLLQSKNFYSEKRATKGRLLHGLDITLIKDD